MFKLRDYQLDLCDKVNGAILSGHNRVIVQLSTGGGKSVILSHIAKQYLEQGKSVLVLTDRIELYSQLSNTINKTGIEVNNITDSLTIHNSLYNQNSNDKLTIAMIETVHRRLKYKKYLDFLKSIDICIIDEAHVNAFHKVSSKLDSNAIVLGFTATPIRTGKSTLSFREEGYTEIVCGARTSELVEKGNLCYPVYFSDERLSVEDIAISKGDFDAKAMEAALDNSRTYDGVVENYIKYANNTKALLFAPTVKSSKKVVEIMCEAGINARHIDASCSAQYRDEIINWFRNTDDAVLSNVGILTKGFDQPDIETIILYRATKSYALYNQMVGRGSRPHPIKNGRFIVLDFGQNLKRHKHWASSKKWSLDNVFTPRTKIADENDIKVCPECHSECEKHIKICPNCDYDFEAERLKKEKEKKEYSEKIELIYQVVSLQELIKAEELAKARLEKKLKEQAMREEFMKQERERMIKIKLKEQEAQQRMLEVQNILGGRIENQKPISKSKALIQSISNKPLDERKDYAKSLAKRPDFSLDDKIELVDKQYLTDYSIVFYLKSKDEYREYVSRRNLNNKFENKLESFFEKVDNYPRYWKEKK